MEEIKNEISNAEIQYHRSINAIRPELLDLLIVDSDYIDHQDSFQFTLSRIRKKLVHKPVLLLLHSSLKNLIDVSWFFNDFILYPMRQGELFIRVEKLIGMRFDSLDESIISIGDIEINLNEYSVFLNNEKINFTYKEFELLKFLIQNSGVVFSRKDLLNKIWGVEYIGGTRTVDVHIRRLRSKLGEDFNALIETVRNVGYRCISVKGEHVVKTV
jgi:DNA-binding response OmpR family regulator